MKKLFLLIFSLCNIHAFGFDRGSKPYESQQQIKADSWLRLGTSPPMTSNGGHRFTVTVTITSPKGRTNTSSKTTYNNADALATAALVWDWQDLGSYKIHAVQSVYCPIGTLTSTLVQDSIADYGAAIHCFVIDQYTKTGPDANGYYYAQYTHNTPWGCKLYCQPPTRISFRSKKGWLSTRVYAIPYMRIGSFYACFHDLETPISDTYACIPGPSTCFEIENGNCNCPPQLAFLWRLFRWVA